MPSYNAPVRDALFLLNDVFRISRYADLPGFADLTPETLQAMLEEAAKFAENVITPLNRVGDVEGSRAVRRTRLAGNPERSRRGVLLLRESFLLHVWRPDPGSHRSAARARP